jgi:hypothetical protein
MNSRFLLCKIGPVYGEADVGKRGRLTRLFSYSTGLFLFRCPRVGNCEHSGYTNGRFKVYVTSDGSVESCEGCDDGRNFR